MATQVQLLPSVRTTRLHFDRSSAGYFGEASSRELRTRRKKGKERKGMERTRKKTKRKENKGQEQNRTENRTRFEGGWQAKQDPRCSLLALYLLSLDPGRPRTGYVYPRGSEPLVDLPCTGRV